MIIDSESNFVYFADYLKKYLPNQTLAITNVLDKHQIHYGFLKSTKDYYCRDYMPVQVTKDKFVQFVFYPHSYFKPKNYPYISNPIKILVDNKLPKPHFSKLILDGGNVVKSWRKVIVTDKILSDNNYLTKKEILRELENHFEAEVIIIPAIPGDDTGHADGMIRFLDDRTVLVSDPNVEGNDIWKAKFLNVLKDYKLDYEIFPVEVPTDDSAAGIYINYLHVSNLILLPQFDRFPKGNDDACEKLKNLYPNSNIEPVNADEIVKYGGVFNCASWNVLK